MGDDLPIRSSICYRASNFLTHLRLPSFSSSEASDHCVLLSSLSTDITMAKGCITVTKYFLFLFNLLFFVSNVLLFYLNVTAGVSSVKALQSVSASVVVPTISRRPLASPHTHSDNESHVVPKRPVAFCYKLPPHLNITGDTLFSSDLLRGRKSPKAQAADGFLLVFHLSTAATCSW